MVWYSGLALGMCGISTILTAMVFHCAENAAAPSCVIRSTMRLGRSEGAMLGAGAGVGAGTCAAAMAAIITGATASAAAHASLPRKSDLRIVFPIADR